MWHESVEQTENTNGIESAKSVLKLTQWHLYVKKKCHTPNKREPPPHFQT